MEELKRVKEQRAMQAQKQKQKERMAWHAKQAKYAAKEDELNNYVTFHRNNKKKKSFFEFIISGGWFDLFA